MGRPSAWFAHRIALFNTLGYGFATGIPTYVDPLLKSHVRFGVRQYPLGFWVLLGCPVIYALTLALLRQTRWRLPVAALSSAPLLLCSLLAIWNFAPEFPHAAMVTIIAGHAVVGVVATSIHCRDYDKRSLADHSIACQARIEIAKETIGFWRMATMSIGVACFAAAIPLVDFTQRWNARFLTDPAEQHLLNGVLMLNIGVFSLYVVVGPFYEALKKANGAIALLSEIKEANGHPQ